MTDFDGPVITNRDPNSRAAAASVEPHAASARRRVFNLIQQNPAGLACWEVEKITDGLHQSVSATINWLFNHGYLARVGKNRTPTGRSAYIYAATTAAQRREALVHGKPPPVVAPVAATLALPRSAPVPPVAGRTTRPCPKCGADVDVAPDAAYPRFLTGFCVSKACRGTKERRRIFRA